MKKILLSVLVFIIPLITYADIQDITFNLSSSIRLDENEGQLFLPTIKIDLTNYITKNLNFSISKQDYLIFASDISKIKINGFKSNIKSINLSNSNKKIKIVLNEENTGKIEIQGIQIRTYDQKIRGAKIGFDYNNDEIVNLYSTNVIDLDENSRYSDNMKPLPVRNIQKIVTKNNKGTYDIKLFWTNSADLDIYGSFIKVNKNNSYGNIKETFIGKLDKSEYVYTNMDLENNIYNIEIYSKDFYYINTDPYIINLDKKDLIIDNIDNAKNLQDTIEVIKIDKISKYTGIFSNKNKIILNKFVNIIDNFISKKKKTDISIKGENDLMIIRNNIVKELEKFDISMSLKEKKIIIKNMVKLIKELKKVL